MEPRYADCVWCKGNRAIVDMIRLDTGYMCKTEAALVGKVVGDSAILACTALDVLFVDVAYPKSLEDDAFYTYQPHVFTPGKGIVSPTSLMPFDYDPATRTGSTKPRYYPYFATSDAAAEWVKQQGLAAHIQRYKITKDLIFPTKFHATGGYDYTTGRPNGHDLPNTPWLTAGVTAVVEPVIDGKAHVPLMAMFSDKPPMIYDTASDAVIQLPRRTGNENDIYEVREGDE